MFTIQNYIAPETIDEAYGLLMKNSSNTIVGGCTFLRLGSRKIDTAIDLSKLNLNYIKENSDEIEIGASTVLRQIETSEVLNRCFSSILPQSVENVVGLQFRNMATIGAEVYSRYGFGEIITALLSLNAQVELYNAGRMCLKDFLKSPRTRDILIKIIVPKDNIKASYKYLRSSYNDFSLLNVSVARMGNKWTIAVGARPGMPEIASSASSYLSGSSMNIDTAEYAARIASEELKFGSNMRASEKFRKHICTVLVKRAVREAAECL